MHDIFMHENDISLHSLPVTGTESSFQNGVISHKSNALKVILQPRRAFLNKPSTLGTYLGIQVHPLVSMW